MWSCADGRIGRHREGVIALLAVVLSAGCDSPGGQRAVSTAVIESAGGPAPTTPPRDPKLTARIEAAVRASDEAIQAEFERDGYRIGIGVMKPRRPPVSSMVTYRAGPPVL